MKTSTILQRLYRVGPRRKGIRGRLRALRMWILRWLQRRSWRLILAATILATWALGHVYYYNRLTMLEFDVKMAWAQVDAVRQKRAHIQRNLVQLLHYYARHEREVITGVTEQRTGHRLDTDPESADTGDSTPGTDPQVTAERSWELLGDLRAIAEAYPSLQLNITVQRFTEAVITTEVEIGQRIMVYNVAVNAYTSVLHMFPGRLFGPANGFETYPFYEPNPDKLGFSELDLSKR